MEETKKYELTDKAMTIFDGEVVLHRIRALKDFEDIDGRTVHAGDLGGWIESEDNLSQPGKAWVADEARVYDDAKVLWDALVGGNAHVCGFANINGNARVYDNALVSGLSWVLGEARVFGDATVCGTAQVRGDAAVCGTAKIQDVSVTSGVHNGPEKSKSDRDER